MRIDSPAEVRRSAGAHRTDELPFTGRQPDHVPGHWVLARLGKRVLRPGGRSLTETMVAAACVTDADVVELAPGLGLTAGIILKHGPRSYTGVEAEARAAAIVERAIGARGRVVNGNAKQTGLADASADVVLNEAMLTMNAPAMKDAIIAEAWRVLRPGGRYAIHELALVPDTIANDVVATIYRSLSRSILVNSRPLTIAGWRALLAAHGFEIEQVVTAPMALLTARRVLADEGFWRTLRIGGRLLRDAALRTRVARMRRTFTAHRESIAAMAIIARKPSDAGRTR